MEALRAYHAREYRRLRTVGTGLLDPETQWSQLKPERLARSVRELQLAAILLRRRGMPSRARLLLWLFLNQENHRLVGAALTRSGRVKRGKG